MQVFRMSEQLQVLIAGREAGTLRQADDGSLSFAYDAGYAGVPLSTAMPLSGRLFSDKVARPFFFGLLPDDPEVRKSLGKEHGVSGNNPFALLKIIGLDCPGAVQVCMQEQLPWALERRQELRPIDDAAIALRLAVGRSDAAAHWETDGEHWSLGGQQSKFALRREDGAWYSCGGAAATTHILKPGISGLRLEALNEFVCLQLARECGVPAARAEYSFFEGEDAIVVERYDRQRDAQGNVQRLHQEDFCQALGVLPQNKYPEDGGPGANDIIGVLKGTGPAAADNISSFISMLLFNYLIAAPDAHAKNYSLLLDVGAAYLAPLYDVASALPYQAGARPIKLAMGIAGENRAGCVSEHRLQKFADINGLEAYGFGGQELAERMQQLASILPPALERVFDRNAGLPGADELRGRLLPKAEAQCDTSIARL